MILKSKVFNISIYNRNVPIPVKMRGPTASGDVAFPRCDNFPIFSHFSHFLAKNAWFWGWYWSLEFLIFQSTTEMYRFWLKWGVHQLLTMWHSWDMVFSPIFSHFSHFLAKNGWFWGWCRSLEFLIYQSTIENYRLWLKWGVIGFWRCGIPEIWYFLLFSAILATFSSQKGWSWGWYWSLEFLVFQSTIEMYRFCLK